MAELLNTDGIERELTALSGWQHDSDTGTVRRTWERKGFNAAMQLANVVAWIANQLNHHPDITVHGYNRVTVMTTTHDAGGVTAHDLQLARRINATLGED